MPAVKYDEMDQHSISLDELAKRLGTSIHEGMSNDVAEKRNLEEGDNKLPQKEKEPLIIKFLKQITGWFSIMLEIAAALCIMIYILDPPSHMADFILAFVLIFVVLITGFITFLQAEQSEALMQSFKNMMPLHSKVIRDGKLITVPSQKLVRGDLVEISNGQKIPADLRIIQSNDMKVDNSSLTGQIDLLLRIPENSNKKPAQSKNLAFFGTLCKNGKGKGIVVKIAEHTFLGSVANLSESGEHVPTPLRRELDRFVYIITVIALSLGLIFILLGYFVVKYSFFTCIVYGIGIIVANVPEGILACVTISLAITAKKLSQKQVLVKNLQSVETLGSTSCICSDKTGTLTMNKMTVQNLWYDNSSKYGESRLGRGVDHHYEYQLTDPSFQILTEVAALSSEAEFQATEEDMRQPDFKMATAAIIGDASESAIIKFIQSFEDVHSMRKVKFQYALNTAGNEARVPFSSVYKYSFCIAKKKKSQSHYCIYLKGAPEQIWKICNRILIKGEHKQINSDWNKKFLNMNESYAKNGQRVLGFAYLPLGKQFDGVKFNIDDPKKYNFPLKDLVFVGLISLIDPPKPSVPEAIKRCRSAGIKVIMVTGDQPTTAVSIAKKIGITSFKSNLDLQAEGYSPIEAFEKASTIVVHGDMIAKAFEEGQQHGENQLNVWVQKPEIVFARTTPVQKLEIVKACQRIGHIVGVTGDGVNDSPAIKQADIGISMGISGSDVSKDAADMILLNDDFSSIIDGIEEGRKVFDNLKKTIVYLLTSNMTQIWPFVALVVLQVPLPLSNILMLVICVGTDIYPAISLAYEEVEVDIMTRKPRKAAEHMVTIRLITHAYGVMGTIATAGGFFSYFIVMQLYGFPASILFYITGKHAVIPIDDFTHAINTNINVKFDYNPKQSNLGCHYIPADCRQATIDSDFPSWSNTNNNMYDLRAAYNVCCPAPNDSKYCPLFNWPDTSDVLDTYSSFSDNYVRFTTQSLFYAQSAYFMTVVLVQWSNLFACKSRKISFIYSGFNGHMLFGIFLETMIGLVILYVPGINKIFGGRPIDAALLGIPGVAFSMLLLIWEEGRKYLINRSDPDSLDKNWFEKYLLW